MVFGPARPTGEKTPETCPEIMKVVVEILPRDNIVSRELNFLNYYYLKRRIMASYKRELIFIVTAVTVS